MSLLSRLFRSKEQPEIPCENNMWMSKFEIKEPDLDFFVRDNVRFRDAAYEPVRYESENGVWKQRNVDASSHGKATLMFTGDITCFDNQFESAKTKDGYDFRFEFEAMKPIFKQADLVAGNIETQIIPDAPYRSEKIVIEENFYCNAPLEFLDAIRWSGIDVLTNANNHDIDAGAVGVGETIDNLEKFGFIHTGTFKDERKRYELIDVNGIRVAIVAFATDHNALTCNITPEGQRFMLNDYSKMAARRIIKEARSDGAEVVFVCIHWGKENWTEVYKDQYRIANELVDAGYDCIIGSHPHVLQKITHIEKNGKVVPIYYSLGNYVSQNFNNIKSRSVVACIDLERNESGIDLSCSYIPIYTSEKYKGRDLVVLPIRTDSRRKKNLSKLGKIIDSVGGELEATDKYTNKDYREDKVEKVAKSKPEAIDLSEVKDFPFSYTDYHFDFTVYEDHARLDGIRSEYRSVSCTVPENILGVPVTESVPAVFENNDHLKKIKSIGIPYISDRLCKNCELLEGFRMGMKTAWIGEEAFAGCTNLYSAVMKRGVGTIGRKAFAGCTNLKSVKLTDNINDIADDAFEGCGRVVFYCNKGSYAEEYAKKHGIKVSYMDVYGPGEDI